MAKMDELMKNEEFLTAFETAETDEAMEAILKSNGVIEEELYEEALSDVSGGGSPWGSIASGLGKLVKNNVSWQVLKDSMVINTAFAAYKVTGNIKYISTKSVNKAEARLKEWSKKNKLNWNDLLEVIGAWAV